MSLSDLPKFQTELTKIGHIFRKQSTLEIKVFEHFTYKSWSPIQIFFTEKKWERYGWFLMPKNDFECTNFANFVEVVYNFGRYDDDMKKCLFSIYADMVWCPTW